MISQSITSSGNRDNCPAIRWTACGCGRTGDTRYTERLSSLGDCPPVSDCDGAPPKLKHTVQIWLSRFVYRVGVYRVGGIVDGTQAQRYPAFSLTESAISCQLSGYLFGLGIAVKAHLSKIGDRSVIEVKVNSIQSC